MNATDSGFSTAQIQTSCFTFKLFLSYNPHFCKEIFWFLFLTKFSMKDIKYKANRKTKTKQKMAE